MIILISAAYFNIDVGVHDLLDDALVAPGATSSHAPNGFREVFDKYKFRPAGDSVAAVVHADDLECAPDDLVGGQILNKLRHASRALGQELKCIQRELLP